MVKLKSKTYPEAKYKTNKPFNGKTQLDHKNPILDPKIIFYCVYRDDYNKGGNL